MARTHTVKRADLLLVGGGLANGLLAYRLAKARPDVRPTLIERGSSLGEGHTWSFHETDLTPDQREWIAPFVSHSWPGYEVRFPKLTRRLAGRYMTVDASRFHDVLTETLGDRVVLDTPVESVDQTGARLTDGRHLEGIVIDARGPSQSAKLRLGYQKFLGQRLQLSEPHGLSEPLLMDATVEQLDGYRFLYVLPFTSTTLLVEDTRYSETPNLDTRRIRADLTAYVDSKGWVVQGTLDEEQGVLPIALSGDIDGFWDEPERSIPCTGLRAALFHATTGYSLPWAVRTADAIASKSTFSVEPLRAMTRQMSRSSWSQQRFFRLLNRMLFLACEPSQRYRVLERFYRLPEPLIQRFYAGRLTWGDRVRLLSGRPPLPLHRALSCVLTNRDRSGALNPR